MFHHKLGCISTKQYCILCHDSQKDEDKLIKTTSKVYTNKSKIIVANNSKYNVEHKALAKTGIESVFSAFKLIFNWLEKDKLLLKNTLTRRLQTGKNFYINEKIGGHFVFYVVHLL